MIPAPEILLALLIVGFYLNDSCTLVDANHAVLEQGLGGPWTVGFPTRRFTILGRHVLIGGLFPPNSLLFKLSWTMETEAPPAPGWEDYAQVLRPYQWTAAVLFIIVMVLLPAALLGRAGDAIVVSLLLLAYSSVVGAWSAVWFGRRRLGLSSRYCLKLGAEMLLCPPVAANLVRRISLQHRVSEDFVTACRRLLRPQEWAVASHEFVVRIEDQLEGEEAGSLRHDQLTQRIAGLA